MFKNATFVAAKLFFLLALFFVPFSTALTNVFVALLFVAFLLAVLLDRSLLAPLRMTPAWVALLLFCMILLGSLWSIAPHDEVLQGISKYRKLLLLPIAMALVWRDGALARKGIIAFMAGAAVLALACYLVRLGLMPADHYGWWRAGDAVNAYAFKNHITIGIVLGFAAIAAWAWLVYAPTLRARLWSLAIGLYFAFPVLFLIQGRTGYVVMLVGFVSLCLLRYRNNGKMMALSFFVVIAAFVAVFSLSANLKMRTERLVTEFHNYETTHELNSSGIRISFYKAGLHMFIAHPVLGTGTGSFSEGFAPIAKQLAPPGNFFYEARSQPHSEVVLMAVQLGIVGVVLYFWLLLSLALVYRKQRSYLSDMLLLLCISFGIPAFFNSLLWDVTEGHWFVLLAGCLYAAARRPDALTLLPQSTAHAQAPLQTRPPATLQSGLRGAA